MAKFCTNCGQELDEKSTFCINCGKEISKQKKSVKTNDSEISKNNTKQGNVQNKNKIIAGGLGIFLGAFGVHNFYLGYNGKAVAQLLITVLSCFTLSIVSAIWGFIEGIMILFGSINVDADGNPLDD